MKLPIDLHINISMYINFEKVIQIFPNIAKYLYINHYHTWKYAVENGFIYIIKWLHFNKIQGINENIMKLCVIHGHLNILKFLYKKIQKY